MQLVVFRHASNTIVREKLIRADKAVQHASQLLLVHNREGVLLFFCDTMTATISELPPIVDEPLKVAAKFRERFNLVQLQRFCGIQRDDANKGTNAEFLKASVRVAKHVVKEAVIFIP